jgi:hypothetical protein
MSGPVLLGTFSTEWSCDQALAARRLSADRAWHFHLARYYELLTISAEPRDDAGRLQLWDAYRRVRWAAGALNRYQSDTACEQDR